LFLSPSDKRTKVLKEFGGKETKGKWDFKKAKTIVL